MSIFKCLELSIRFLVGGLLAYSGAIHLAQPLQFASAIAAYQLIPESWIGIIVSLLPAVQIVVGMGILLDPRRVGYAFAGGILFAAFVLFQSLALFLGREISCGCFGLESEPIGWLTLLPPLLGLAWSGHRMWHFRWQSRCPQRPAEAPPSV